MKVILKEDIDRLGKPGDVVKVSEGYARNYLLPRRKALPATEHNLKNIEQYKVWLVKKQLKNKTAAEEVAAKLAEVECVIERKAGKNNKLFGSVTSQDIFKSLVDQGFKVDRRCIELKAPIKELGETQIEIKLHAEVSAKLKVTVKVTE